MGDTFPKRAWTLCCAASEPASESPEKRQRFLHSRVDCIPREHVLLQVSSKLTVCGSCCCSPRCSHRGNAEAGAVAPGRWLSNREITCAHTLLTQIGQHVGHVRGLVTGRKFKQHQSASPVYPGITADQGDPSVRWEESGNEADCFCQLGT